MYKHNSQNCNLQDNVFQNVSKLKKIQGSGKTISVEFL